MLQFPYLPVPLVGPVPPSSSAGASCRFRPFVPITIRGPAGQSRYYRRALVDPGSDDTIFPLVIASRIGVKLRPDSGHRLRWTGQAYPLRFGDVQLELSDGTTVWRWPAIVAFCDAPIPYRLLGYAGCLEFMDVLFRGGDRIVELNVNSLFPGTIV